MGLFVKVQKDSAYFKRFRVKYRRRREAKTDYKARRRLIQQAKNKYNTPKYRFVVRITNRDVIAQVVHSKLGGDVVIGAAYAHELPKYGPKVGLTNYAACYATGLLAARRVLTKVGLADKYDGPKVVDGKHFIVEESGDKRPFVAVADTGLARTTSGARVFAVIKGAVDGGLAIPHSPARFSGYANGKLDEKAHRYRLLGGHVADHMKELIASGSQGDQFSKYIAAKVNAASIEQLWLDAHNKIRADPKAAPRKARMANPKAYNIKPLSSGTRLHIRDQRRAAYKRTADAAFAEDEDSDE